MCCEKKNNSVDTRPSKCFKLVQKWIRESFNSKGKILVNLVICVVAPVIAFRKTTLHTLQSLHSFSPSGTSSTATTLTRKTTMRKSQRYSMSVVQDKHHKNDIPMWVCKQTNPSQFHSFIVCRLSKCCAQPCFPFPWKWSARPNVCAFRNQYIKNTNSQRWIRSGSLQFYYRRIHTNKWKTCVYCYFMAEYWYW